MRFRLAAFRATIGFGLSLAAAVACKAESERSVPPAKPTVALPQAMGSGVRRSARPISSEVRAFETALQRQKLAVPPRREHTPQLAFGKNVLGRLTHDALSVFDLEDFRLLATVPLESPRAVVGLVDGSLLAIDARALLHWQRDKKRSIRFPRPVLWPSSQVYGDAQQADLFWVFDAGQRVGGGQGPALLQSYRLKAGEGAVLLPEQTIELSSGSPGVFGMTREGVWLYVTAGRAQRLSPGGLRLPGLSFGEVPPPTWLLPSRRLDQSLWLEESGRVSRNLVSPTYKELASSTLSGRVVAADVGDEGRLLAAVVVTAPGPRFELELRDQELAPLARAALPSDDPTGTDDWVKVVTENQAVAVDPKGARVAVGGPSRLLIFNGRGERIFSIPSM